jgi:DNA-binding NarL/FixJ family response regulator
MSETSRPRILIADDHALIAEAFKAFLVHDFEVIGTVLDGRSLIQVATTLRPDVILTDIGMPVLNGLDAAERIKRALPAVKLICVSVNHDTSLISEAFRRGASGYLLKTAAASELVTAIRQVLEGQTYLSSNLVSSIPRVLQELDGFDSGSNKLTDRQLEVLQLLAEGRSMKEIAALLKLATRTVAFHKYRIMDNLNLNNDAEVVQYAMRQHIVFAA